MIEIVIEEPGDEIFEFGDDDSDYKRLKQMFSDSDDSSESSSSSSKSDVKVRVSQPEEFNAEPSSVGVKDPEKSDLLTARHEQIMKEFEQLMKVEQCRIQSEIKEQSFRIKVMNDIKEAT